MSAKRSSALRSFSRSLVWFGTASAAFFVAVGFLFEDPYFMVAGLCLQFAANIAFALRDIRSRILFLFLHFGIFLFWLTRPVIGICYGTDAWLGSTWDSMVFSLFAPYLSMTMLLLGSYCCSQRRGRAGAVPFRVPLLGERAKAAMSEGFSSRAGGFVRALRISSFLFFAVCACFAMLHGAQLLSYMSGRAYEEYYLTSVSDYSSTLVSSLAGMSAYALAVYLATMPKRRPATVALVVYVATTLPELLIGSRGGFAMAALFLVFYYLFRNAVSKEERWITRRMVVAFAVALPLGVVALGIMNYTRQGTDFKPEGFVLQLADTLYKQGVTFKVLQYGFEVNDQIAALGPRFYLLGSLINTITQGFVGQQFLGSPLYPSGNNLDLALNGSLYAHAMSAFAHPNYLGGEGYGSAYILEAYADLGMGGVAVVSFAIGYVFAAISSRMGDGWFVTLLGLMAGNSVFHMARGSALEWLEFLWSTRFWLTVVAIFVAAFVLYRFGAFRPLPARGRCGPLRIGLARRPESQGEMVKGTVPLLRGEPAKGGIPILAVREEGKAGL